VKGQAKERGKKLKFERKKERKRDAEEKQTGKLRKD
jgi:hypothetical protein